MSQNLIHFFNIKIDGAINRAVEMAQKNHNSFFSSSRMIFNPLSRTLDIGTNAMQIMLEKD